MGPDASRTKRQGGAAEFTVGERPEKEILMAEMERLRAEIKEKEVLLEAREMEIKMIKQSMEKRIRELERIVKRQAREKERKSRFVSFIGAIDKRH